MTRASMHLNLSFNRRSLQIKSAVRHGGLSRILEILAERRAQGYSTRSLTYSWPKEVFLHHRLSREKCCHFLMPHLLEAGAYGGIATLAKLVVEFAQNFDQTLVYLTDYPGSKQALKKLSGASDAQWTAVHEKIRLIDCSISPFVNLVANTSVDHFVATAWWTKASLDTMRTRLEPEQLTYVIQDEESLFYDPRDKVEAQLKTLALKSYVGNYRSIVNSSFLADYLKAEKLLANLKDLRILEPQIRKDLFFPVPHNTEKILWVYARPDVRRNRFDVCLEALKILSANSKLSDWKILGAGTLKKKVFLGNGHYLEPLGKLELHQYARLAQHTSVALCLMESPHPSYPPLELERAGAFVVCNSFANKDYSVLGPNFLCSELNSQAIAKNLALAVERTLNRVNLDS